MKGLPADCLYMVTAPADIGGVVIVTETGIIHVDQAGRIAAAAVSGWWRHVTLLRADVRGEYLKLSLQGSKGAFVEKELVLVLADGSAHQVKLEMDGRAVGAIVVQERSAVVPPPANISVLRQAMFVGCAEGDSVLYNVDLVRDQVKGEDVKPDVEMDADDDGQFASAQAQASNRDAADVQTYTQTPTRSRQMDTAPPARPASNCMRETPCRASARSSTWSLGLQRRTRVCGRIRSW